MPYARYAMRHNIQPVNQQPAHSQFNYSPPEEMPASMLDYLIEEKAPLEFYPRPEVPQAQKSPTPRVVPHISKSYYDDGVLNELKQIKYLIVGLLVLVFLVIIMLLLSKKS